VSLRYDNSQKSGLTSAELRSARSQLCGQPRDFHKSHRLIFRIESSLQLSRTVLLCRLITILLNKQRRKGQESSLWRHVSWTKTIWTTDIWSTNADHREACCSNGPNDEVGEEWRRPNVFRSNRF
jgi:hypothetical protein